MDGTNNPALILSIIGMLISIIGAGVQIYKAKPEKKKLDADAGSAIGDAAESVANGARVTVDMLTSLKKDLEENLKQERAAYKAELNMLRSELKDEREARIRLQSDLEIERQARIRAENKMKAFQQWINLLLDQLDQAKITPAAPPSEWNESKSH